MTYLVYLIVAAVFLVCLELILRRSGNVVEYCCGFYVDGEDRVLLLHKLKPAWQRGKMNGVGGRIETGESPLDAMRREFVEEAGQVVVDWSLRVTMRIKAGVVVYFFVARGPVLPTPTDCEEG